MLLAKIVNLDKSDVISGASREMLLFCFNKYLTLAHSNASLATQEIVWTSGF